MHRLDPGVDCPSHLLGRRPTVALLGLEGPLVGPEGPDLPAVGGLDVLDKPDGRDAHRDPIVLDLAAHRAAGGLEVHSCLSRPHPQVGVGLGTGLPVDAAHDVLGHGPPQRGVAPAVTRRLSALLGRVEDPVVVPVDPAGHRSSASAADIGGVLLSRGRCNACVGDGDTVLVVAVPAVVVVAVGPVAEALLGLGVSTRAQVGPGGLHAGGVDEAATEQVIAVAVRDLTTVPPGLQEGGGTAVGDRRVTEVGDQDQPQGDSGVARSLHGDGGAGGPFHEHGDRGPTDAVGLGVASAVLVDALLRRVVQPQGAVPVGEGRAGRDRPPGASSGVRAVTGAPAVQEAPGDSLVAGDLGLDPLAVEGLIGAAGVGGLRVGEDQAVEGHRCGAAVGGLESRGAGDVEADA